MHRPDHTNEEAAFQKQQHVPVVLSIVPDIVKNDLERDETYLSHLAAIVESSDDAIISKSLEGIILSWNKGSEIMFGYKAKEAVGKSITMLIPPELLNEERNILERICNNEIIDHFETSRIRKNGEQLFVSLTISPLKDSAGAIIGVSKIARDISARKKTEAEFILMIKELDFQNKEKEKRATELFIANKELVFQNDQKGKRAAELLVINKELIFQNEEKEKRAAELIIAISDLKTAEAQISEVNKELESFSYSVSHDLRAPLRAINGYTNMLKNNFKEQVDPEANRLMNNIVHNARKMGLLIDDLLTFSRIGRRELVKVIIPMDELVCGICNELKSEVPGRNIEFRIANILPGLADNMAIKQVWLNLVSNAIKYSRLKDTAIIEISSKVEGEEIRYSIKDNGAGFDMRYASKLFGVFQRLHSEDEFEGTGVGLALVHRIISKHGGRTWAEAKLNEGATFYFTLQTP